MSRNNAVLVALQLADDKLYRAIATADYDAFPRDALRKGREMYEKMAEGVRDLTCKNAALQNLVEGHADEVAIVSALADLVSARYNISFDGAVSFATLTTRFGLTKYCGSYW